MPACPGTETCKFGIQDSLGLGKKTEEFFLGVDLPAKLKIGVSAGNDGQSARDRRFQDPSHLRHQASGPPAAHRFAAMNPVRACSSSAASPNRLSGSMAIARSTMLAP